MIIHINQKNFLTVVQVVAVVGLAVIPLFADPAHLGWRRWQVAVVCLASVGVCAVFRQAHIQSREDHDRAERERESDSRQDEMQSTLQDLLQAVKTASPPKPVDVMPQLMPTEANGTAALEGEIHRIFMYARLGIEFSMFKEIWKAKGQAGEPVIDCDIIVSWYIVNKSSSTKYIRSILANVEVDGKDTPMEIQEDFRAGVFNDSVEYGWDKNQHDGAWPTPLEPLFPSKLPCPISTGQPLIGWVRFLLRDVNPDGIDADTWRFSILDSVGNQYPVTKIIKNEKKGGLGLRRVSS